MHPRCWILVASLLGASGVGLGAFHAHGLSAWLERQGIADLDAAKRMANCETAVRHQLVHAPVILFVGLWSLAQPRRWTDFIGTLFIGGVLLFSGGLYLYVFTGQIGHWAIVPGGGMLLIVAWLATAAGALMLEIPGTSTVSSLNLGL